MRKEGDASVSPLSSFLYFYFSLTHNQPNSEAIWTPQRIPSSNALRSCSVHSLMIMKNIALFVSRGSVSKYLPSCANSDLVSGGSLSLDSQYAVYRNSKIAVAYFYSVYSLQTYLIFLMKFSRNLVSDGANSFFLYSLKYVSIKSENPFTETERMSSSRLISYDSSQVNLLFSVV